MTLTASLAMYDLPWLRWANDAVWTAISDRLSDAVIGGVPLALTRDQDLDDIWQSPSLLVAQSCGYPLMTSLRESVQLVATPRYDAEGCDGAFHRAAILVRADEPSSSLAELRGRRLGINSTRSNTGMNLLRSQVAPHADGRPFFGKVTITGSHARSVAALLSNRIDIASIDAVTLAHLRDRYPRHCEMLKVLDWTAASPGLPLITAATTSPETLAALRSALLASLSDPRTQGAFGALRIIGFEQLSLQDYAPVLDFETSAIAQNYPVLT